MPEEAVTRDKSTRDETTTDKTDNPQTDGDTVTAGDTGLPPATLVSTWLPDIPPLDITTITFGDNPTSPIPPIPDGFFGRNSLPFVGQIGFRGLWVGPGDTSTVIQRLQDPFLPVVPSSDIVPIEMVELHLTSLDPITVQYSDGQEPTLWRVQVELDTQQPSVGDMQITRDQPNGGTFLSSIEVRPVFTFTDTRTGIVLSLPLQDFGGSLILQTPAPVPWVQQVSPELEILVNPGDNVVPGIAQLDPTDVFSQTIQPFTLESLDNGDSVRHVNCPPSDRKYCIYEIVCIEGPCKACPLKNGECFNSQCPNDTCSVMNGQNAFCGGPDCCIEFGPFDCRPLTDEFQCPPVDSCTCDPTPGACCFDDGSCIDGIAEANCQGTWMGAGSTCGSFGACCLPGGDCIETFQVCCEEIFGGVFEGGTCDPPVECCFPDGSCMDMDPECCELQGGVSGPGTCDPPQQCCLPDGSCIETDPDCCDLIFGGTPGQGACQLEKCCLGGGNCIDTDPDCCELVGGTPAPGLCEPLQACCLPVTSACINVEPTCCVLDFGGTPQTGLCQPPEACCNPADNAACEVLEPRCCMDRGWLPGGPNTDCDPMGVCCIDTDGNGTKETCDEMSEACCELIPQPHMFHPNETCGPEGACCYDSDNDGILESCEMMTRICCENLGFPSSFHPNDTCQPVGACCYDADGMNMSLETCEEMSKICCDNLPAGTARSFTEDATCNPEGSCCYDLDGDGNLIFEACEEMAQICCQVSPPLSSFIAGEDCSPTGVCCLDIDGDPNGVPEVCQGNISQACCEDDPDAVSFHAGATCAPTGACCYDSDADGYRDACTDGIVEECCEDLPLGRFTANEICGPTAACCFDTNGNGVNDACINTDELCCDDLNGLWGPPGLACGGVTGGCCYNFDPGTGAPRDCEQMDSLCCTDISGIFSPGQACGPSGACCWDGTAFPGIRENCAAVIPQLCCSMWPSANFQGGGTLCAVANACCFDSDMSGDNDACAVMSVACCNDIPGFDLVPACLGDTNGDGIDEACDDCQPDCDKTNVECLAPSPEYDNRRPVGRMLNNGNGFCTGFIVAGPDCIMTNRHCITTDGTSTGPLGNVNNLAIEFNFECDQCVDGECKPTDVYQVTGLLHDNPSLDYALLRVAGNPAAAWGIATVDPSNLNINDAVYEIHHGGALKKGYDSGVVTSIDVPGVCDPATAIEVGVSVIASGGASGSPVFRQQNHCVSAVCHCGPDCMPGYAIPMSAIWPDAEPRILAAGCTPSVCGQQTTGACCTPNGACQVVTQGACTALGGAYQGNNTACLGIEGCCFANGTCSNIDRLCCVQQGGLPQGAGTVCLGDANGDNVDDLCGSACPLSVPIEPENKLGTSCTSDADCSNQSVCVNGSCYVPKNKYISFEPGNAGENVAIRVTLVSSSLFPALVGESWWVQPNDPADPIKTFRLGCTKHYQDWGSAPVVIHVGDENITSGAVYAVETLHDNCPQSDPASFAAAVNLPTVSVWGDCCGALQGGTYLPPDGLANLGDVFAAVLGFQNAPNRPNREWIDVDPDRPNGSVNLADVFRFVQAFQGSGYPYPGPTACP
ncbi:MAG: trypsin-like serine peptidase [Phycisphaerae bacterium]